MLGCKGSTHETFMSTSKNFFKFLEPKLLNFFFFFFMVMTLQLEEKLTMSDRNREKHQAEIKAKQRRREEKAKRVRNKAKQIQEGDDVVGLAVDHDETYNADEEGKSTGLSCIKGG